MNVYNVWVLFADGDFDQTCYSEAEAKRERRDLTNMGFVVRIKRMTNVEADKLNYL